MTLTNAGAEAAHGVEAFLTSSAAGLFMEMDGDSVRQGTLTGPTAAQTQRLAQLTADLAAVVGDLNRLATTAVPDLNAQMNKAGVPRLVPPDPIR